MVTKGVGNNTTIYLQEVTIMSQQMLNHRIKLPHSVFVKSTSLLPMLYTVRELAEEITVPERTLRDWLANGAPHTRDHQNHIWIDGQAFAGWVHSLCQKDEVNRLKSDQGCCMTCNRVVVMNKSPRNPSAIKLGSQLSELENERLESLAQTLATLDLSTVIRIVAERLNS